jgi:dienelactone hydrolase
MNLQNWLSERASIRSKLWQLLGEMPPLFAPEVTILEREERDGCLVERIAFDNGAGATVYGYFLRPPDLSAPAPAILYHHMHGNKYDLGKNELFQDWLIEGVMPGPTLVRAGFVVLCIDAYCFGERTSQGPAGESERGAQTEQALFKHFVWQGGTLWGMMVRDDLLALNYLLSRPEVAPNRVGVTGMSMGGSRTTWLCALDDRPKALVPVAQMTRYADFAATGRYNLHGIYYYLPGMLRSELDMEHLVALPTPRPQLVLIGDSDPLSPMTGIRKVETFARAAYVEAWADERVAFEITPGLAHKYAPAQFRRMVAFFEQTL